MPDLETLPNYPSQRTGGIVLLDRDGVLNSIVIDSEHGTIDSPLHPSQVVVYPWVPQALKTLCNKNYKLFIVTNQPAFAKGKTTRENLLATHQRVVEIAESAGAKILGSQICFHRSEDQCDCRKPKPGLLIQALANERFQPETTWMVGDGVTDVLAGQALGLKTAFIGPKKWDAKRVFTDLNSTPTLWVENLLEFSQEFDLATHSLGDALGVSLGDSRGDLRDDSLSTAG